MNYKSERRTLSVVRLEYRSAVAGGSRTARTFVPGMQDVSVYIITRWRITSLTLRRPSMMPWMMTTLPII